jgi:XTP/dITP diphosphohydrolase
MADRPIIVIATRNRGKVEELTSLLHDVKVKVRDVGDFEGLGEIEEDADTFEGNALKKARVVAHFTGHAALADDSGLEVDALDGAPGVHSARYAGPGGDAVANRLRLLDAMRYVEDRRARFRCVLAFVDGQDEWIFDGSCEGEIIHEERGEGGFGYDPLFVPEGYTVTFAEMTRLEKNTISHRGRAMKKLKVFLGEYFSRRVTT